MKFIIIGSGGCVCLPKPLCQCRICVEARKKGGRYKRYGCSLYLEDVSLLVDTPEDIAHALNASDIRTVEYILYTHRDPDHTLGMRIFEQLRLEWIDYYEKIPPRSPVEVCATPEVMETLNGIGIGYGAILDYYVKMGLANRRLITEPFNIGNIQISAVPVGKSKSVSVFMFENDGRKVIYAPCDCKPFPMEESLQNADLLIIGNTFVGDTLKNDRSIGADHPLRQELHSIEDVLEIKRKLFVNDIIVTHIEEDWGKSYDDYITLEDQYGVKFAYDGMVVEV
ncbi:MAG: MBL fold metallo-hydrolase [Oscillospiraceae bacterium]|jgi:phosphoribosyl 1,2-cyclic phosphate phosphodiesterase|nr:MBL fold metallo-hydrolase [Oscillospiraceae bacterium]